MGLEVSLCTEGVLILDPSFNDGTKWFKNLNWTIPSDGFCYWNAPVTITGAFWQLFDPVVDHLYQSTVTVTAYQLIGGNVFQMYVADSWLPGITAVGTHIQYHKPDAVGTKQYGGNIRDFAWNPGDHVTLSKVSFIDLTCEIAKTFGMATQDFTMYEYWLLDNNRVMFTFANLNGHQNVTLIYDPN